MKKLFGTDGIRGKAYVEPLDEATVRRLGAALATLLQLRKTQPHILLAGDTRASTPALAEWLGSSFVGTGGRVTWAEVLPTPAVSQVLRDGQYQAGVVISASHNPAEDNGIKVLGRDGEKLNDRDEAKLESAMDNASAVDGPGLPSIDRSLVEVYEQKIHTTHTTHSKRAGGKPLDGLKVVVDAANGAASGIAARVLDRLGAEVIEMSASPDGANINRQCGATSPEALARRVVAENADGGLALDGDADRGVLVDESGQILDGDDILLAWALALKNQNQLPDNKVVATVMSNFGLERALVEKGMRLVRCSVGDRAVWETMCQHGASLGGEQSGHIICSHHGVSGDGLLTGSHLFAIAARNNCRVSELSGIQRLPQILLNVPVAHKKPFETLTTVQSELEATEHLLHGRGRVLLRYSGTESLARVMVEGDSQSEIEAMAQNLADVIRLQLS